MAVPMVTAKSWPSLTSNRTIGSSSVILSRTLLCRVAWDLMLCGNWSDFTWAGAKHRDVDGRFHYAALQGELAAALRNENPDGLPQDVDTIVFVDNTGPEPRILLRSRAIFAVFAHLDGPLRSLRWLGLLPQPLTDFAYRGFAAIRYRVFGKLDHCRMPTPEERDRFLD